MHLFGRRHSSFWGRGREGLVAELGQVVSGGRPVTLHGDLFCPEAQVVAEQVAGRSLAAWTVGWVWSTGHLLPLAPAPLNLTSSLGCRVLAAVLGEEKGFHVSAVSSAQSPPRPCWEKVGLWWLW